MYSSQHGIDDAWAGNAAEAIDAGTVWESHKDEDFHKMPVPDFNIESGLWRTCTVDL